MSTETTARIRWEDNGYGGFLGYVGTHDGWLFQVFKDSDDADDGDHALSAALPGALGNYRHGNDPEKLKAEAEEWLAEFVTSLGAIFPGALRSEVESMRADKHQLAADHEESGHDWQTERCYGAVEALDWALSLISAPETTPAPAGEE